MLELYINNESSKLKTVVLGTSEGFGNTPFIDDCMILNLKKVL